MDLEKININKITKISKILFFISITLLILTIVCMLYTYYLLIQII